MEPMVDTHHDPNYVRLTRLSPLERYPAEILKPIFTLACSDGGITGCALSLVSKNLAAQSRPYRFFSVSLLGLRCLEQFEETIGTVGVKHCCVDQLLVSDVRVASKCVPRRLPELIELSHLQSGWHERRLAPREIAVKSNAQHDSDAVAEPPSSHPKFYIRLKRVLKFISLQLRTLAIVSTCPLTCVLQALSEVEFPHLETLRIYDKRDDLKPSISLEIKMHIQVRMPALQQFMLSVSVQNHIFTLWRTIHLVVSSCLDLGAPLHTIVLEGIIIDSNLPNSLRCLLGRPAAPTEVFVEWGRSAWDKVHPRPTLILMDSRTHKVAVELSARLSASLYLPSNAYVRWAFEQIEIMRADGVDVKSLTRDERSAPALCEILEAWANGVEKRAGDMLF
jgi:hypothetical protein